MDAIRVVELVIGLKTGKEVWEGTSYHVAPQLHDNWGEYVRALMNEVWPSAVSLIDMNKRLSVSLRAQTHTMKGLLARKMRLHLRLVMDGQKPAVDWVPMVQCYWALGGASDNG